MSTTSTAKKIGPVLATFVVANNMIGSGFFLLPASLAGVGGVTAFVRSPAVGAWEDHSGDVQRDDVVLFEVMADHVDHGWWAAYRAQLEQRFQQDEVLVRAVRAERL